VTERIPGPLDVNRVLVLAVREERPPAPAALSGELVAPAEELVEAFAATLVARPQTRRAYERAFDASRAGSGRRQGRKTSPARTGPLLRAHLVAAVAHAATL
jgi:hypothetical protein